MVNCQLGLKMHNDDRRKSKRARSRFYQVFNKVGHGLVHVERVLDCLIEFGTVLEEDGPILTYHRYARRLTQDKPRYRIDDYKVDFLDEYIEDFGQDLGIILFDELVEELIPFLIQLLKIYKMF